MKLQRDQVVAATLVGTVVVVLGFASGIGRVPLTCRSRWRTTPRRFRIFRRGRTFRLRNTRTRAHPLPRRDPR
ncbi:hypothetical protein C8D87_102257 [Lentzea atacamensis]|uniref:Uncharacterized protein n=1 Tax=Lentzea atacamensis TaxID=531938 RepID=A0ABX9EC39_9PSEU|nr:hypothetical protein [Lentzea atacamensis]RAS68194.1 hypothetical protein C8D87_102257 [Lentzea atacamensis]